MTLGQHRARFLWAAGIASTGALSRPLNRPGTGFFGFAAGGSGCLVGEIVRTVDRDAHELQSFLDAIIDRCGQASAPAPQCELRT